MHVEASFAQAAVEAFDEQIFCGFLEWNKVELHAAGNAQSSRAREVDSVP
jgi:hypothetical protein